MYDQTLLQIADDAPAVAGGGSEAGGSASAGAGGEDAGLPGAGAGGDGAAGEPPGEMIIPDPVSDSGRAGGVGGASGGAGAAGVAASAAGGGVSGAAGTGGAAGAGSGAGGTGGGAGAGAGGASGSAGGAGSAGSGPCVPSASVDCCPSDPNKTAPGVCGCGVADSDSDSDTIADCIDPAPYGWLRQITLDGTQIGAALADFPVLVRLTDTQLRDYAAASGKDIYFAAANKTTLLDFEIESYSSATGALVAWVRMPSLSAAADATLFLGYADGGSDRSDPAGVWSGHHYVWHLGQNPALGAGALKDSAQNADGTAQGNMSAAASVAGVAGNGLSFDGVDDQVVFTNDVSGSGSSTISGWVKLAADSGDLGSAMFTIGNGNTSQARFVIPLDDRGKIKCGFYSNDDASNTALPTGSWKYVVWVWNGSQTRLYVDATLVFGPTSHSGVNTSGTLGKIGAASYMYDYWLTGQLDEVRLATTDRSAAWISTEYKNQRPGSTFLKSVGSAAPAPSH